MTPKPPLPKLREDLSLQQMDPDDEGFPTWVIHDEASQKYFLIGWLEFEILSRWELGSVDELVKQVNQETTLKINAEKVAQVIKFLATHELLQTNNEQEVAGLVAKKVKVALAKSLVKHYLFFLIPLVNPDRFLEKTLKYVKPLFSKTALLILLSIGLIGFYLLSKRLDEFFSTFNYLFEFSNIIILGLCIVFVKIIHELSHAYVAKYFGCRVSTIGVAFIVLWPVMYTDTSDVWKLKNRSQRALVALAGVISELSVAIIAVFLWNFVDSGLAKYILFFIATVSFVSSLFINLNPIMRFDGYYFFSDLINVSNLQSTAFELGRWRLREFLFHFGEPAPIPYPRKKEKLLLFYAYFTWVYRFFLFLGIALLVYFCFFKLLGIILMLIEVMFFILLPILSELKNYWLKRQQMTMNLNTVLSFSALFCLLLALIIPWNAHINAPAELEYLQHSKLYTQSAGEIVQINFENGALVQKGQLLLSLRNYNLDYQIKKKQIEITQTQLQIDLERGQTQELGYKQTSEHNLKKAKEELKALEAEQNKNKIYAPFNGYIFEARQGLAPHVWLDQNSLIGDLVNPDQLLFYAYVSEKDINRIHLGAQAKFYPRHKGANTISLKVIEIDSASVEELNSPYLASQFGGEIFVQSSKSNELHVQQALYRISLSPDEPVNQSSYVETGTVKIEGERESYLAQLGRLIVATLIKESGF